MGITFSIIGIICGFLLALIGAANNKMPTVVFGVFLVALNIFTLYMNYEKNYRNSDVPTALDVYRGRTTLQITYKDSVAIDSVVVFKD